MHSKSVQKKIASHKKTSSGKVTRRSLVISAEKHILEAKKKRTVVRKRIATIDRHHTSRYQSFVLIWSSLFLSQLLSITRV